jgi:hypothetical protein
MAERTCEGWHGTCYGGSIPRTITGCVRSLPVSKGEDELKPLWCLSSSTYPESAGAV